MKEDKILQVVYYLSSEGKKLKDKYTDEKELEIDYVCIFSQSEDEYNQLSKAATLLGEIVDSTPTGFVFAFKYPPKTIVGSPKLLKIRKPDKARTQRGDVDFNTDYKSFKNKYLNNHNFSLIKRKNFEMIELKDASFNVLVYFSSIPPSQQLSMV